MRASKQATATNEHNEHAPYSEGVVRSIPRILHSHYHYLVLRMRF